VQIGGRWGELEGDSDPDLPGGGLMRISSRNLSAALCIGREHPLQPRILFPEAEPIQPAKLRSPLQSPQAERTRVGQRLADLDRKCAFASAGRLYRRVATGGRMLAFVSSTETERKIAA
jgi:hypothetical protein